MIAAASLVFLLALIWVGWRVCTIRCWRCFDTGTCHEPLMFVGQREYGPYPYNHCDKGAR